MLKMLSRFIIMVYGNEDTEEEANDFRENLFTVLGDIETFSAVNNFDWVLTEESEKVYHAKKDRDVKYPLKIEWKFVASKETLDMIQQYFNDADGNDSKRTYLMDVIC